MLDNEGPIETARQGPDCRHLSEDLRVDLVIRELQRYNIPVASLQETKWFGSALYEVGRSVVLTAGRPTPQAGQSMHRGEGVAIILSGPARTAWKTGGEQWKTWGSRLIRVTLVSGKRRSEQMHIFSCYASTFAASREMKEAFYDDLQSAIDEIPAEDTYVILGDFNAQVGSQSVKSDQWHNVRGPCGLGQVNEAGAHFLNFLSLNEATICNTWFQKKNIHKETWQHPRTKAWHCIDFAVMKQKDRKRCVDATVKRGAECNSDHQLLRIKVRMAGRWFRREQRQTSRKYAVSKLSENSDATRSESTTRRRFVEAVATNAKRNWMEDHSVEDKWQGLRSALTDAAESVFGFDKRRNPDWFRESTESLEHLLCKRNQLYSKWLSSGRDSDKQKFLSARRSARRSVRAAKNAWFLAKAEEAQKERFGGKRVWQCIHDMQRGRRGPVPTRTAAVRDEDGTPCKSAPAQHQRWRRHFSSILNIRSQFSLEELEKVRQRPIRSRMAELPTMEELILAVGRIKPGKAGGSSGILPEMLKASCCDEEFRDLLLNLVQTVWRERRVPQDWSDAVLVPIPKKGDLTMCDNWRGISLLDVVGKVAATVVQGRLQQLAEEVLPESQCGFRKGRGCSDMIFTIRQLIEKSNEHKAKVFLVFIDLKKAYDSVPREALWVALGKLGVPDSMIELIQSFHQDIKATIRLGSTQLDVIEVGNGLRQGCCMAPALFNLYSCLVVERWTARTESMEGVGVHLRHQADGKTVPEIPTQCM